MPPNIKNSTKITREWGEIEEDFLTLNTTVSHGPIPGQSREN